MAEEYLTTEEVIPALQLLQYTTQQCPLLLNAGINALGGSPFPASDTYDQAHLICSPASLREALSPRFVPGQPWKITSELRLPHDFLPGQCAPFSESSVGLSLQPKHFFPSVSRQAFPRTCKLTVFFGSFSEPNHLFSLSFPYWEHSGVLKLPGFSALPVKARNVTQPKQSPHRLLWCGQVEINQAPNGSAGPARTSALGNWPANFANAGAPPAASAGGEKSSEFFPAARYLSSHPAPRRIGLTRRRRSGAQAPREPAPVLGSGSSAACAAGPARLPRPGLAGWASLPTPACGTHRAEGALWLASINATELKKKERHAQPPPPPTEIEPTSARLPAPGRPCDPPRLLLPRLLRSRALRFVLPRLKLRLSGWEGYGLGRAGSCGHTLICKWMKWEGAKRGGLC